jgi:hypothetical protein
MPDIACYNKDSTCYAPDRPFGLSESQPTVNVGKFQEGL